MHEHNKFNKILYMIWKMDISLKIQNCGKDTKKLYSLIRELTSNIKPNPMPVYESPEQLYVDFAEYFMQKLWQ